MCVNAMYLYLYMYPILSIPVHVPVGTLLLTSENQYINLAVFKASTAHVYSQPNALDIRTGIEESPDVYPILSVNVERVHAST